MKTIGSLVYYNNKASNVKRVCMIWYIIGNLVWGFWEDETTGCDRRWGNMYLDNLSVYIP